MASKNNERTGSLGFEDKLWTAADLLRNNMDPAEYKHVALGLIFLKYISDAFLERQEELKKIIADPKHEYYIADLGHREAALEELLEDRDEYTAENVFWVPKIARWDEIQARAKQKQIKLSSGKQVSIGGYIDHVMDTIEKENKALDKALPKVYGLPNLSDENLGELIDLIGTIGLGSKEHREKDTLGRVYEYFLSKFASAEGKGGGEFYTPTSVVRVLVEMLEPYSGRVYDPCCGSGGMFVQSLKFIEAHGGKRDAISIFGQESNRTTWRMARMNLAIRGIEAKLGPKHADSFHEDLHPDLRADFILANPPFNTKKWGGDRLTEDPRWNYGIPPTGNANFGWLQHIVHHLRPGGVAGVVLANGSMSSTQSGEGDIRRKMVEAKLVDCVVALPPYLFYSTPIPACLWIFRKKESISRDELLAIDARSFGTLETKAHRVLEHEEISRIANTYHSWRDGVDYEDQVGFCRSVSISEITKNDYALVPGRYVEHLVQRDEVDFGDNLRALIENLSIQIDEGLILNQRIASGLREIGFEADLG